MSEFQSQPPLSWTFDLTAPPLNFVEDPYPVYRRILEENPVQKQRDGSYLIASHKALATIYRDTRKYSSDKKEVFFPKFGQSPLYEHHTTSLVFNDPPLHTRVRKIMAGAMTPGTIAGLEQGLVDLVDRLLDELPDRVVSGSVDLVDAFASQIPINVIGNLFDMPMVDREPLRDWSLAILGALEPSISPEQAEMGNTAVTEFKAYLADLAKERRRNPGDPETDLLTRLMSSDKGTLTETELLQNCIFILNAGHETTTNLIGNSLGALNDFPDEHQKLLLDPSLIATAIDEFLRFESPNQLGNRLTTESVTIDRVEIPAGANLNLLIGAANRDASVFKNPDTLNLARKPNKHLAFAGGPHSCIGLNLARMEGRIAIGKFVERFPEFQIIESQRSTRLRFRGYVKLNAELKN